MFADPVLPPTNDDVLDLLNDDTGEGGSASSTDLGQGSSSTAAVFTPSKVGSSLSHKQQVLLTILGSTSSILSLLGSACIIYMATIGRFRQRSLAHRRRSSIASGIDRSSFLSFQRKSRRGTGRFQSSDDNNDDVAGVGTKQNSVRSILHHTSRYGPNRKNDGNADEENLYQNRRNTKNQGLTRRQRQEEKEYQQRKRQRPYHRLMAGMSIASVLFSTTYFLQPWFLPRHDTTFATAVGTTTTCSILGFIHLSSWLAMILYNGSLSIHFLLVVVYRFTNRRIHANFERYVHFLVWIWPSSFLIPATLLDNINPNDWTMTCTLHSYPPNCDHYDDYYDSFSSSSSSSSSKCTRGINSKTVFDVLTWTTLGVVSSAIVVCTVVIYFSFRRQIQVHNHEAAAAAGTGSAAGASADENKNDNKNKNSDDNGQLSSSSFPRSIKGIPRPSSSRSLSGGTKTSTSAGPTNVATANPVAVGNDTTTAATSSSNSFRSVTPATTPTVTGVPPTAAESTPSDASTGSSKRAPMARRGGITSNSDEFRLPAGGGGGGGGSVNGGGSSVNGGGNNSISGSMRTIGNGGGGAGGTTNGVKTPIPGTVRGRDVDLQSVTSIAPTVATIPVSRSPLIEAMAHRAILYCFIYFNLCLWPSLIQLLDYLYHRNDSNNSFDGGDYAGDRPLPLRHFILLALTWFLFPLQGFFNLFLYMRPSLYAWRLATPHTPTIVLLYRILKGQPPPHTSTSLAAVRRRSSSLFFDYQTTLRSRSQLLDAGAGNDIDSADDDHVEDYGDCDNDVIGVIGDGTNRSLHRRSSFHRRRNRYDDGDEDYEDDEPSSISFEPSSEFMKKQHHQHTPQSTSSLQQQQQQLQLQSSPQGHRLGQSLDPYQFSSAANDVIGDGEGSSSDNNNKNNSDNVSKFSNPTSGTSPSMAKPNASKVGTTTTTSGGSTKETDTGKGKSGSSGGIGSRFMRPRVAVTTEPIEEEDDEYYEDEDNDNENDGGELDKQT